MPARRTDVSGLTPGPVSVDPGRDAFFLVTCEHGGNRIPEPYLPRFAGHEALLESHRGHDPGALEMARDLAEILGAPLVAATTSRLLVDLNRSLGHPKLFSEVLAGASRSLREDILAAYYRPYRQQVEDRVNQALVRGRRVIHLSSHSFTPVLNGEERRADIGLLYDPGRPGEVAFCRRWQDQLQTAMPGLRVRRNYPYTGKSDGFCAWLRRRHSPTAYVGVELEINQKYVLAGGEPWRALRQAVGASLAGSLAGI